MGYQPTKPGGKQNPPQSPSAFFTVEEAREALLKMGRVGISLADLTRNHPWNEKPEMLYADPEWTKP